MGGVAHSTGPQDNPPDKGPPPTRRGGLKASSKSISWKKDGADGAAALEKHSNLTKASIDSNWHVDAYIPTAAAAATVGASASIGVGAALDRALHTIPASPLPARSLLAADASQGPSSEGEVPFAGFPTVVQPAAATRPLPKHNAQQENNTDSQAILQKQRTMKEEPNTPSPPSVAPPRTRLRNTILDSCDSGEYDVLVPAQAAGQAGVQDADGMWLRSPLELGSAMHSSEVCVVSLINFVLSYFVVGLCLLRV